MSSVYDPMDECDPVAATLATQWDAEHGQAFARERIAPILKQAVRTGPTDPSLGLQAPGNVLQRSRQASAESAKGPR